MDDMKCYRNGLMQIPYSDYAAVPNEPMTNLHRLTCQDDRYDALQQIGFGAIGYVPYYGEKLPKDADFYYLMNHALVHGVNKFDIDVLLTEYDDLDLYPDWGTLEYDSFDTSLRYMIAIASGELFRRDPYMLRSRAGINPPNRFKF